MKIGHLFGSEIEPDKDEKRKVARRGVKHVLKTIKELASNSQVMDALSDQIRELLAKATEELFIRV